MSILSTLENEAVALIDGFDAEVVAFFKGAMASIQANGGAALVKAITDVVVSESNTGATGAQKMASAVESLKSDLGPVALNALHAGIEAAVANLPAYQVQQAPAASATPVNPAV